MAAGGGRRLRALVSLQERTLPPEMLADDEDDFAAPVADRTSLCRAQFASAVACVLEATAADSTTHVPTASTTFAQHLTDIAFDWTSTALGPDLSRFASHAGRRKVGIEDVLLAGRKNDATLRLLEQEAASLRSASAARPRKQPGVKAGGAAPE